MLPICNITQWNSRVPSIWPDLNHPFMSFLPAAFLTLLLADCEDKSHIINKTFCLFMHVEEQGVTSRYHLFLVVFCEQDLRPTPSNFCPFSVCDLSMNHVPDIYMTSSDLVPAVVRKEMTFLCLGALREGDWQPGGSSRLTCHAFVPEPDPWSPTTSPNCSLSTPTTPEVHR